MSDFRLEVTSDIDHPVYRDAVAVRRAVFIGEQQVSEAIEIDADEARCFHLVLYADNQPVATARILPGKTYAKIQRVAVIKSRRGQGIGQKMMAAVHDYARYLSVRQLRLGAQKHAVGFYQRLGYIIDGEEYSEAGIAHVDMYQSF